ncbi:MAG: ABC transporter permease, partial [Anaerolineae bacterium]|nr:ABC transporter permease [Anaerolineae bacterium]
TLSGIGLGVLGALEVRIGSSTARMLTGLSLSVPIYWTGTLAIYLFTAQLGWLPSAGAGRLSQLILPVLVLGFHTAGAIARVMQASLRDVLASDFVRTAQAKGLHRRRIIGYHACRVAVIPVISIIVLQAGFLFSGTVITESLFVRPGIGRLLLDAVLQQDYPIVLGVVCLSACVYLVFSLFGDLTRHALDPRVVL